METIAEAIDRFREKQLEVYKCSGDRIICDANGAEQATGDHIGRWFFELLQNAEDAGAGNVCVLTEKNVLYVADNGGGLTPETVKSICSTYLSGKTSGTIGRKGVGFKSVYGVSGNPQVLTVGGEGIEFNRNRAENWLKENDLDNGHVPHQWIPFLVQWDEARNNDPALEELRGYKTVIRLPDVSPDEMERVEELIRQWPPHALLTFRHVRQIKAPKLDIRVSQRDHAWEIFDSRGDEPTLWLVAKHKEMASEELLATLKPGEREAIRKDGVGFLIAAPVQNDAPKPTEEYLPVHVFYPTEETGPVRLLLHAEFLVKSDRTALLPFAGTSFNTWVAERLAFYVCEFVNASFRPDTPSTHAAMLVPFGDRDSHPVAEELWQHISSKAKTALRLADVEGCQRLAVGEARLISVSVCRGLARTVIEATDVRHQLLHASFDADKEARKALKELGCEGISDQELMVTIAENADRLRADEQWVLACWEWLAEWVAKASYGEDKERILKVKELPLVPVGRCMKKLSDLGGRIVTWKSGVEVDKLPDWLPLTFVDTWFRDHIKSKEDNHPIRSLCEQLKIKAPEPDVVQKAVGKAIAQYWKEPRGDPKRFLDFIMDQDWHETSDASSNLQRCPVPLSRPVQDGEWAEARNAYLGSEWDNDLLADLYADIESIAWVKNDLKDDDISKRRQVMEWLGVFSCPRVVNDPNGLECEKQRVGRALPYCTKHRDIDEPKVLEHLDINRLRPAQAIALVKLLRRHWGDYYSSESILSVGYRYYGWHNHSVDSLWWYRVKEYLPLPLRQSPDTAPLRPCWLPDKKTQKAIGELLPVIDLDEFEDDKETVRDWLIETVGLRTRGEQLTVEEWKEILSTRIPDKAPAESSDERRDAVKRWYEECLETVADNDAPPGIFASCPLLCQKGKAWQYITDEPKYLGDDNDLSKAFADDTWLIHIPSRLLANAERYFGVKRLSKSVSEKSTLGEPKSLLSDSLQKRLNDTLQDVWVWRSSRSRQDAEALAERLKNLKVYVVPTLKVDLDLNGVRREMEPPWRVEDGSIYLRCGHTDEIQLARALAEVLKTPSEADFYQNLLRCDNDDNRKENLLSKRLTDDEVKRGRREYTKQPEDEAEDRGEVTEASTEATEGHRTAPLPEPESKASAVSTSSPSPRDSESPKSEAISDEQASEAAETAQEPEDAREPLRLKVIREEDITLGHPPEQGGGHAGGGGGERSGREGRILTDQERLEVEQAGRSAAKLELEKTGFGVEEMKQKNPGFDLRATKDNKEHRIEVKAHMGSATKVALTAREYEEYQDQRQQGYLWELWNVEHLAEDDNKKIRITKYVDIPSSALDAREFVVDLRKCQGPQDSNP
jgi:hypothetical protein